MPVLDFFLDERSPIERELQIAKGSLLPPVVVRLLDDGEPVSLTGATVVFSMVDEDGTMKITEQAGDLLDADAGKVRYEWAAADVNTENTFFGQFKITVGSDFYLVPNNNSQRLRIIVGPKVE